TRSRAEAIESCASLDHDLFRCNSLQVRGATWDLGRNIHSVLNLCRINEILMQVGNTLEKQGLMPDRNVIEQHEVLMDLAHTTHVGHNWQPEFPSKQADSKKLCNLGLPGTIYMR